MTTVYTRDYMGWAPTKARTAITNTGLVIHWNGGDRNLSDSDSPCSKCKEYWAWCRRFHMNDNGWVDVGYSYFVCPHGNRYPGRQYGYEQAAQPGGNQTWTSVTTGLGGNETLTVAQINGIKELRTFLMNKGMKSGIRCHSDFINTDCPGDKARKMVRNGTFTGRPTPPVSERNWLEMTVAKLPTLKLDDKSFDVKTVRGLLYARGYVKGEMLPVLGDWLDTTTYTTQLESVVMAFQRVMFPTIPKEWDGIVGQKTWIKLLRR